MLSSIQWDELRTNLDFIKYIEEKLEPETRLGENNYPRTVIQNNMLALEIQASVIEIFNTYPQFQKVKLRWYPDVDDGLFNLTFKVKITENNHEEIFGYEHYPASIKNNEEIFRRLVEICEEVGPHNWNEFEVFGLGENSYTSAHDVHQQICSDLIKILSELERWYLDHANPNPNPNPNPNITPSQSRSSPRL